jgi:hypothetical protein
MLDGLVSSHPLLMAGQSKLECSFMAIFFQAGLITASKVAVANSFNHGQIKLTGPGTNPIKNFTAVI